MEPRPKITSSGSKRSKSNTECATKFIFHKTINQQSLIKSNQARKSHRKVLHIKIQLFYTQ